MSPQDATSTEGDFAPLLAGTLEPCFWYPERLVPPNSWAGHIPFAFWLVIALRPRILVELGVHSGNSYAAFCQAVQSKELPTRCFGVDSWMGDPHAGFYGEDVYTELSQWHDAHHAAFSRLIRSSFDEAAGHFAPGTVDLLHIDGEHTYEAVQHDFETWRSRLSARGIVLFHDTNVRERDFGVWRVWQELSAQYPSFEFVHGHGLGVLGIGTDLPLPIRTLFKTAQDPTQLRRTRGFFARLGDPLMRDVLLDTARKDLSRAAEVEQRNGELARLLEQRDADLAQRTAELEQRDAEAARLVGEAADLARLGPSLQRAGTEVRDLAWSTLTGKLPKRRRDARDVRLIRASGAFDIGWYLRRYPDVASSRTDPVLHYVRHGAAEGRDPSPDFSTALYRARHPDLPPERNPLADALEQGRVGDGRPDSPGPGDPNAR